MKNTDKKENPSVKEVLKAKLRMAFWLFLFYLITLAGGFITFPFLGNTYPWQNVIYGIIIGAPFWIIAISSIVSIKRELSSTSGDK